jgi:hypothetical protein
MVEKFVTSIVDSKKKIKAIFDDETTPENLRITAKDIFKNLSGNTDPENLILLDTSGLVPILYATDPKDFKLIDQRGNIGGFYKRDFNIYHQYEDLTFPLIVINGNYESYGIREHEEGHAENDFIGQSTDRLRYFWLRLTNLDIEKAKRLQSEYFGAKRSNRLIDRDEINKIIAKWRPLLFKILDMAKDEILADFGFSFNFNHIDNLRKKENCYFIVLYLRNWQNAFHKNIS